MRDSPDSVSPASHQLAKLRHHLPTAAFDRCDARPARAVIAFCTATVLVKYCYCCYALCHPIAGAGDMLFSCCPSVRACTAGPGGGILRWACRRLVVIIRTLP